MAVFSSTTQEKDCWRRTISMAMRWLESGSRQTVIQSCGETRFTTGRKGACVFSTVGADCWRRTIFSTMHSQVCVCVCVCVCVRREEGKVLCVCEQRESRLARDEGKEDATCT